MTSKLCTRCKELASTKYSPWCRVCLASCEKVRRARNKELGICSDCGSNPVVEGILRCQLCVDIVTIRQHTRLREIKDYCVDQAGRCCVDCGLVSRFNTVYDFHHLDPTLKSFNIGEARLNSLQDILLELDKVILLCSNCHRIRHEVEYEQKITALKELHKDRLSTPKKAGRPRTKEI